MVRGAISNAPITRSVVDRFIPGETTADVVAAVVALRAKGLQVTLDHLGEDTMPTGLPPMPRSPPTWS